jgi:hypothetical protein
MTIEQIITMATTILSAVTGLFAAIAACRSAGSAESAEKRAEGLERRGLVREIIRASQNTIGEAYRLDELASELQQAYMDLFTFAGDRNRAKPYVEKAESDRTQASVVNQRAKKILDDEQSLHTLTIDKLSELLTRCEGDLQELRQIKDDSWGSFDQQTTS